MGTRALIKNKGYKDIAVFSDGYPDNIIPILLSDRDVLKEYRAEYRTDDNGFTAALCCFDYVYFYYKRMYLKPGKPHYREELRVYKLTSYKARKFKFHSKFILKH